MIRQWREGRFQDLRLLHSLTEAEDVEFLPNPSCTFKIENLSSAERLDASQRLVNLFGRYGVGKTSNATAIRARFSLDFLEEETNRSPRPWEQGDPYNQTVPPEVFDQRWQEGQYLLVYRRGQPDTSREKLSAISVQGFQHFLQSSKPTLMIVNPLTLLAIEEQLGALPIPTILIHASEPATARYQRMRKMDISEVDRMNSYGLIIEESCRMSGTVWISNPCYRWLESYTEHARRSLLIPMLVRRLDNRLSRWELRSVHPNVRNYFTQAQVTRAQLLERVIFRQRLSVDTMATWYWLENLFWQQRINK